MQRWMTWIGLTLAGCGGEQDRAEAILELTGDAAAGERIYLEECASCHGAVETADPESLGLGEEEDLELVEDILYGEEGMPAYEEVLSDQEIADVFAFLKEVLGQPGT